MQRCWLFGQLRCLEHSNAVARATGGKLAHAPACFEGGLPLQGPSSPPAEQQQHMKVQRHAAKHEGGSLAGAALRGIRVAAQLRLLLLLSLHLLSIPWLRLGICIVRLLTLRRPHSGRGLLGSAPLLPLRAPSLLRVLRVLLLRRSRCRLVGGRALLPRLHTCLVAGPLHRLLLLLLLGLACMLLRVRRRCCCGSSPGGSGSGGGGGVQHMLQPPERCHVSHRVHRLGAPWAPHRLRLVQRSLLCLLAAPGRAARRPHPAPPPRGPLLQIPDLWHGRRQPGAYTKRLRVVWSNALRGRCGQTSVHRGRPQPFPGHRAQHYASRRRHDNAARPAHLVSTAGPHLGAPAGALPLRKRSQLLRHALRLLRHLAVPRLLAAGGHQVHLWCGKECTKGAPRKPEVRYSRQGEHAASGPAQSAAHRRAGMFRPPTLQAAEPPVPGRTPHRPAPLAEGPTWMSSWECWWMRRYSWAYCPV